MGKLVNPKTEWICENCGYRYIKWSGTCYRGCQFTGTIKEHGITRTRRSNSKSTNRSKHSTSGTDTNNTQILPNNIGVPKPVRTTETAAARKLRRRAKDSERGIARRMQDVDGPDPAFRNIASSTGRIGHITGMRIDAISRSYVTENKNRKMPSWLIAAWVLINQRAVDFNKNALLHVDPPNMPKEFVIQGGKRKLDTLAIISQTRHEELIHNEKVLQGLLHAINTRKEYQPLAILYEQLDDKPE